MNEKQTFRHCMAPRANYPHVYLKLRIRSVKQLFETFAGTLFNHSMADVLFETLSKFN